MSEMLSWKLSRNLEFTLEKSRIPGVTGHQVLVKVHYAGVCHSDLNLLEDGYNIGNNKKRKFTERKDVLYPVTPGHEISGVVYAVAGNKSLEEGNGLSVGDKVLVYPWIHCGTCDPCLYGACNLCSEPFQGEIGQCDQGGYSQYVVVPNPRYLVKVPEAVAMDTAALLPCSGATAFNALRQVLPIVTESMNMFGKSRVMVIGLGGLGLWTIKLSKVVLPPSSRLIAVDINEDKLLLGQEAGAHETLLWKRELAADTVEQTKTKCQGAVDAVIDFVNTPQTVTAALECTRNGGRVVVVGLMGGSVEISLPMFVLQNKSLQGVGTSGIAAVQDLARIVAEHKVLPPPIKHYKLEDAKQALEDLQQGKIHGRAVLKIIE